MDGSWKPVRGGAESACPQGEHPSQDPWGTLASHSPCWEEAPRAPRRQRAWPPMGATHKSLVGGPGRGCGASGARLREQNRGGRGSRREGVAGEGALPRACLALWECFRGEVRGGGAYELLVALPSPSQGPGKGAGRLPSGRGLGVEGGSLRSLRNLGFSSH